MAGRREGGWLRARSSQLLLLSPSRLAVSRIVASSTTLEMDLSLDVATDIYPISPSQSFSLQLVSTLHPSSGEDGAATSTTAANGKEVWRDGAGGLAEDWDYVMYGKVSGRVAGDDWRREGEGSC